MVKDLTLLLFSIMRFLFCFVFAFVLSTARSEVLRVEIESRVPVANSNYEELSGHIYFAVDPAHPRNAVIADIDLAPKNSDGKVEFASEFHLLIPPSPVATWVDIPNRGGRSNMRDLMIKNNFALFEIGWEFDVDLSDKKINIDVPHAVAKDGATIRGVVESIFIVNKKQKQFTVSNHTKYLPVDPKGEDSRLVIRDSGDRPGGEEVPRDSWKLAKNVITLDAGFEPGKTYEISWLTENPPVAGLGFAAIRDAVSWLKNDTQSPAPNLPAYAFGSSQCGRFLREFVYEGFNTDEHNRAVLDGIIAHIAGAGRVDLNRRWSTPKELALFRTASYPFADEAHADPVTGLKEGLLENQRVNHRPKIFYTTTAAEYWGAGRVAALVHTDPTGEKDVPLPEEVRIYVFAGNQHGPSGFPPDSPGKNGIFSNPVNYRPCLSALRMAMHRWIADEKTPPANAYPQFKNDSLVPVAKVVFPKIPGVSSPHHLKAGVRKSNSFLPKGAGAGEDLPLLVSQVDADGNDLAGIRLPEITVPLATATGWMFRPASIGAPDELMPVLRGSWIPFPRTKTEREQNSDPRRSIEERYMDKDDFLNQTRTAAEKLVEQGYFLPDEVENSMKRAGKTWDWISANR